MLDKSIAIADRRQFTAVRDPRDWKNPFLMLNADGSVTVITGGANEKTLPPEAVKNYLVGLSPLEWPFGRVVSVRPCSARSEDKQKFDEEDRLLKKSWGTLRDVVRALQVEMNMWPSGDSTHAVIKRETNNNTPSGTKSHVPIDATQAHLPDRAEMEKYMRLAIAEARAGISEGGFPCGAVLVKNGAVVARGHNRCFQTNDPVAHAEMTCLRASGGLDNYADAVLYTSMMPCVMCAGAVVQLRIPVVVAGESKSFRSERGLMERNGVRVVDLDLQECFEMAKSFAKEHPEFAQDSLFDV